MPINRSRRLPFPILGFLFLSVCAQASQINLSLSGKVAGATDRHTIFVALWDQDGFLRHPVRQVRIPAGTAQSFQFQVPPGRWALSAFEDVNENGILDMGMFGPKEPSGFWRPFHAWRKPHFDDVASQYDRDFDEIVITVNK